MKPVVVLLVASAEVVAVWGYDDERLDRVRGPPDARSQLGIASPPREEPIMKRLAVVVLATLAALMAAAPSAQAAPPTHDRVPIDATFTDHEACGFPVEGHATGFMLVIEWVDEDGTTRRFEGFPQSRLTLTNLTTGESITANTAGSAHITENPDGSLTAVGTGNWGFPVDPETGEPAFPLFSGRWVFSMDAQGNTSFRFVGRVRDLCAELAA